MASYNYLALVRREEVIDLFKNGIIYPGALIQFEGTLESLPIKTKEVAKVFDKVPVIDYSINYFLLYAVTENKADFSKKGLNIVDLVSIIPLDYESARMGLPLEPPIKLSSPIFEANFMDYQEKAAIENARKGVQNIAAIFGVDNLWKSIKKVTEKNLLPRFASLLVSENSSLKPESIWEYLLCYTRNQIYPNDIRGAFLDTMSVVNNWKNEVCIDIKDQKQTTTGRLVMEQEQSNYITLVECISSSSTFSKAADKAYKDFWKIAPLYFILLDFFSHVSEDCSGVKGIPIRKFVSSVINNYDHVHLKPALLMLGITLGQSSTYKLLYAAKKEEFPFLL